jgi:hypothetical protein
MDHPRAAAERRRRNTLPIWFGPAIALVGAALLVTGLGLGMHAGEGHRIELQAQQTSGQPPAASEQIARVRDIIERRLGTLDAGNANVSVLGTDRVVIELRGPDAFRIASAVAQVGAIHFVPIPRGHAPPQPGETLDLDTLTPLFDGEQILSAGVGDDQSGGHTVDVALRPQGQQMLADYTMRHVGEYLAIVLDAMVVMAPQILEPITEGQVQFSGGFALQEARNLVMFLSFGPLPVPIEEVSSAALGAQGGLPFAAFGGLTALLGGAVTLTAIRQRHLARMSWGHFPEAAAVATGVHRFSRSPIRIAIDLVVAPIGAAGFIGGAVVMIANAGQNPGMLVFAALFGFFGLIMAASAVVTVRRGIRSTILEVRPDGIWTADSGLLPWSQVREVRLETVAPSRVGSTGTASRRLGIVPLDPSIAARSPGRMARELSSAFHALVSRMDPRIVVPDLHGLAPFGIEEHELEVPLETVIPTLAVYMPVVDRSGRPVLPRDQARSATGASSDAASAPPVFAPERLDIRAVFTRRSLALPAAIYSLVGSLLYTMGPVILAVVLLVLPGEVPPLAILFVLLFPSVFVLSGIPAVLGQSSRLLAALGPRDVVAIGPDGVRLGGRPLLAWEQIDAIRIGKMNLLQPKHSPRSWPRLEIVPTDTRRLAERPWPERAAQAYAAGLRRVRPWGDRTPSPDAIWVDLGILDADPDEVIDLVDRYRPVEAPS